MNDDQWLQVSDYVCGEELRETQISPFGPKIYIFKCTFFEIYIFKHAQENNNNTVIQLFKLNHIWLSVCSSY